VVAVCLIAAAAWPPTAQAASPAVGLRFDPAVGTATQYVYGGRVALDTRATVRGKETRQQIDIKTEWACRVERLADDVPGDVFLRFTLLWLSRQVSGSGLRAASFDSRASGAMEGPMGPALAAMLNKPIVLRIDSRGRIVEMRGQEEIVRAATAAAPEIWRDSIEGLLDPRSLEHKIGAYLVADAPAEAKPGTEWHAEYRDPLDAQSSVQAKLECVLKQVRAERGTSVAHIQVTGELKPGEPLTSQPVARNVRTRFLGGWLDGRVNWDLEQNRPSSAVWAESSQTETSTGEGLGTIRTLIVQNSSWSFAEQRPAQDDGVNSPKAD
jgi:hypothetical protein